MPLTISSNPSGAGTFTVQNPASASSRTLTLPDATTTLVGTDAAQTLTNKTIQGGVLTQGTPVASTSGTVIDFTGIPSWAKRITVMLSGVSTSGSQSPFFQVGTSSGFQTTGYDGRTVFIQSSSLGTTASATGFPLIALTAITVRSGSLILTSFGNNTWLASGTVLAHSNLVDMISGGVTLSGTLDRVRFSAGGTDTFDAGSVNIMWEG